ncbi:hypothetical protein PR202_gb25374 [Eleusine coracana subsp. coracana]|uniref:Uncharacterized protein n=1 Tax=Eleusine coracana subsp. coracana TaxID=191504 RepID=A0AAV5FNP4_ELECO|nr:hypothetical protein PR202_gb25330 [Eleusine coracana subsp. coracana]GJN36511.1 hypothetical protein PR202_gb25374 [Eleusine coracana subsp. coracana]
MVLEAQRQLVQEIANGGIREPPSQYVHREEDRPTGAVMAADMVLPTVDVSRLVGAPDDHVDEAAKLRSALESDFFYLTPEEKLKYSNVIDGDKFQHEGIGIDRVETNEQILDWCDRLYLKVQPEDERQLELWPSHPQFLTALLHEYTRKCEQVTKVVLGATATGLGFTEEFFIDKVGERVTTFARFSYYPPCARPDLVYGVKPHTDNSVLSILLLDKDVGGLQVLKDAYAAGKRAIDFLKLRPAEHGRQPTS